MVLKVSFLSAFLVAIIGCGKGLNQSASTGENNSTRPNYRKIVVTANAIGGNSLGFNEADSLATLDSFCSTEVGSGYKAMVSSSTRNAATNWVLTANTEYRRADGTTVIGTTDSSAVFSFPLTNSISDTFAYAWTGMNANWTTNTDNCTNWTGANNGQYGKVDEVSAWAISYTQYMCAAAYRVYCVEQ